MEYAFPFEKFAFHGSDLLPLFVTQKAEIKALLLKLKPNLKPIYVNAYADALITWIGPRYRDYFASFAVYGNPNQINPFINWPVATQSGGLYTNVLQARLPALLKKAFGLLDGDQQNGQSRCAFWTKLAGNITAQMEEVGDDLDMVGDL